TEHANTPKLTRHDPKWYQTLHPFTGGGSAQEHRTDPEVDIPTNATPWTDEAHDTQIARYPPFLANRESAVLLSGTPRQPRSSSHAGQESDAARGSRGHPNSPDRYSRLRSGGRVRLPPRARRVFSSPARA